MATTTRHKHNWTELTAQFMASDFDDFGAFVRSMGLPPALAKAVEARGIAERKRGVIKRLEVRIHDAILADPMRKREEKKRKILDDLEKLGDRLKSSVMVRLNVDAVQTNAIAGESPEQWAARIAALQATESIMAPSDLMALAGAARVADEIVRKATGLEDYDWESEAREAKLKQKGKRSMEIEIVKTSHARSLDALPIANEEKKKA